MAGMTAAISGYNDCHELKDYIPVVRTSCCGLSRRLPVVPGGVGGWTTEPAVVFGIGSGAVLILTQLSQSCMTTRLGSPQSRCIALLSYE